MLQGHIGLCTILLILLWKYCIELCVVVIFFSGTMSRIALSRDSTSAFTLDCASLALVLMFYTMLYKGIEAVSHYNGRHSAFCLSEDKIGVFSLDSADSFLFHIANCFFKALLQTEKSSAKTSSTNSLIGARLYVLS